MDIQKRMQRRPLKMAAAAALTHVVVVKHNSTRPKKTAVAREDEKNTENSTKHSSLEHSQWEKSSLWWRIQSL
jgi:hypothetical protein